MYRNTFLALVAVATLSFSAFGQTTKPDFSGTWKLDTAKSVFNEYIALDSRTDVITQDGDNFTEKVSSSGNQGNVNYTLTFIADGKSVDVPANSPGANQGVLTLEKISAVWQDSLLVVSETLNYQGQVEFTTKATFSLSPDGKVLTIDSHADTQAGDIATKYVFNKQ